MRQLRQSLSGNEHQLYAKGLAQQLQLSTAFQQAERVACYLAQDGELSLCHIITLCWQLQKQVFLPHLKPLPPNRLWFVPYTEQSSLAPNRYGIDEPTGVHHQACRVSELDIVLFPLVAFDTSGGRLGMGGGFYDRTFAHLSQQKHRPLFIGIALEEQKVETLPTEAWDLPLDAVATPDNFYSFAG
ncbi:5-formyltetrahydrofolate cyclo-ligase [Pleionea sp. CnH1-48]|nr:5-formyltetrahydrofolate cyclo-ligase [Pleionea sp. CnH1-48]